MTVLQTGPQRAAANGKAQAPAPVGVRRRRSTAHILFGAVLVVVCALVFAVTALRVDPRVGVLALAGPVQAGHVLTDADLSVVHIVPDAAMSTVAESQRSSVVGRSVKLPLAARSLLSDEVLGPVGWPPQGQSLIAVPVKSGRAPSGLVPGVRVLVLVVPSASSTTGQPSGEVQRAPAEVYAVEVPDSGGTTVVSLLLSSSDAVRIVGAVGEVALVVQGGRG